MADLTAAVEAAAIDHYNTSGNRYPWDDLPEQYRQEWRRMVMRLVIVAAPIIERQAKAEALREAAHAFPAADLDGLEVDDWLLATADAIDNEPRTGTAGEGE